MKYIHLFIFWLTGLTCLFQIPAAFSQSVYIDPVDGDNRNPGISSATAKKNAENLRDGRKMTIRDTRVTASRTARVDVLKSFTAPDRTTFEWTRIILGPQRIEGWQSFADTIWKAPLVINQGWLLEGVSVGNTGFEFGCAADFIGDLQFFWEPDTLYINDPSGNPDATEKVVKAYLYAGSTESTREISGWSAAPPAVWESEYSFSTEPIHVYVDDALFDDNSWLGPQYCDFGTTGQAGFLYLRDADGNPDSNGKQVTAIVDTGGWGVASGDFNGDGLADVVHSNSREQVFINYGASDFSPSPGQILTGPLGETGFGFFVASAGDVNQDGFDELMVAADWDAGKVYLFMGSLSGLSETFNRIDAPAEFPAYGFGHGIAGNGDINADGYGDLVIMGGDASQSYLGVYLGSAAGIGAAPDSVIAFTDKMYGGSVCLAGDMNQDGFDEVAVSMAAAPPVSTIEVRVYHGAADGMLSNPSDMQLSIPTKDTSVHAEVAPAGDVNSDGFADLVIGNQWAQGEYENEGKAYIVLGFASGPGSPGYAPDFTIDNPLPESNVRFGSSISAIADVDRDGYGDVAVGCPYGRGSDGFVAVYSGSAMGVGTMPSRIIEGVTELGWSLSGAGDLKGTGQDFLITGEEFGAAYLYALPCNPLFYPDADGDGYGDASKPPLCIQEPGYVADNTDLDDSDPDIYPGSAPTDPDEQIDGGNGNNTGGDNTGGGTVDGSSAGENSGGGSSGSGCFISILS